MSIAVRGELIALIDEAIASGAPQFRACEVIGLDERRLRRWRLSDGDGRTGGYRAQEQALTEAEKDGVVEVMKAEDLRNLPPKQAYHSLMDRGVYLCSYTRFLQVLKERTLVVSKRKRRRGGPGKRPQLAARAPNQVWCWDITWLESPIIGKYFSLYMIIDLFSRKVVGWGVAAQESGALARKIFAHALETESVCTDQLIVHADNDKPMRSSTLQKLFELLAVTASHGRPHTSNDNAYAESLFATFKGRVAYPEYFRSLRAASEHCAMFFAWYNTEHLHSGLNYLTPIQVHSEAIGRYSHDGMRCLKRTGRNIPNDMAERKRSMPFPETVRLKPRVKLNEKQARTRIAAPVLQHTYQIIAN
ncbi:MAG: IS3 family transposase [Bacteroidetes bacterium]|nr:IS3 family transposase [Bacteroidota bacterium]